MLFDFEKILKDNEISETDPDLPRGIIRKIEKFRAVQAKITPELTIDDKQKIESELDKIDAEIMQTLPDYFEFEDEAEILKAKQLEEKAKQEQQKAKKQAKTSTKEAVKKVVAQDRDDNAKKAEEAARQARIAELSKPASSNKQALANLFELGKTTVTKAELTKAGFDTGFFGPIGPNGCKIGEFVLYRDSISSTTFTLTKK